MPGIGLDCVGVALIAARAANLVPPVAPYRLNAAHDARLDAALDALRMSAVETAAPGDLLVFALAPQRRHLAILTAMSPRPRLVHAHAGLGFVVESTADPAWHCCGVWRFPELE